MRPAFTLVELLVALAVLGVGILALAATASLVAGHVGDGGQLTSAAHVARTTLDSLTARPCAELVGGSRTAARAEVAWRVTRDSLAAAVQVSVSSSLRRRGQTHVYEALVPCARP
jgi:prepilin-type N-terminal cleavage/methylation domain-containing protein